MKLITPIPITDVRLISSSVPENDFGEWSSSYGYSQGNSVIKGHRIWQSVQSANIGNDPETAVAGWWLDVGPTNRWAMFDGVVGTSTTKALSFTVTLQPGRIDSLVLMDVDAADVVVTQRVGATVITQRTLSLIEGVADWFDYFMSPIVPRNFVVITDLPIYGESTIEITLSKNSGTVSCGVCVVGMKADLGLTKISPSIGINDYSRKTTDDFGRVTLVRRDYSKRGSFRMIVNNTEIDRVFSALADARATPAVWVGDDQVSSLILYGFFRDFELDIAYATVTYCTLNIEGMI